MMEITVAYRSREITKSNNNNNDTTKTEEQDEKCFLLVKRFFFLMATSFCYVSETVELFLKETFHFLFIRKYFIVSYKSIFRPGV